MELSEFIDNHLLYVPSAGRYLLTDIAILNANLTNDLLKICSFTQQPVRAIMHNASLEPSDKYVSMIIKRDPFKDPFNDTVQVVSYDSSDRAQRVNSTSVKVRQMYYPVIEKFLDKLILNDHPYDVKFEDGVLIERTVDLYGLLKMEVPDD